MLRILVLSLAIAAASALPTAIYYESVNEDSVDFFANQFADAWATHGDSLEITFVPFGSAYSYEDSEYFNCYDGPSQCFLNKVQLCTLSQLATASAQAEYVICAMAGEYPGQDVRIFLIQICILVFIFINFFNSVLKPLELNGNMLKHVSKKRVIAQVFYLLPMLLHQLLDKLLIQLLFSTVNSIKIFKTVL